MRLFWSQKEEYGDALVPQPSVHEHHEALLEGLGCLLSQSPFRTSLQYCSFSKRKTSPSITFCFAGSVEVAVLTSSRRMLNRSARLKSFASV